jgi:UPF0755 protein
MASPGLGKKRKRSSARRAATATAVVLSLLLALVLGGAAWLMLFQPQSEVAAGKSVLVRIPDGAGTAAIGHILAEKGVVQNATMFRLQVRIAGADGKLRAGDYDLKTGSGYRVAIDQLESGATQEFVTVTIPEGFVLEQIATRLQEKAGIPHDDFIALAKGGAAGFAKKHPYLADAYKGSLEGYLFPKTYRIRRGASASEVIEMMLSQFDREIAQVDMSGPKSRGLSLAQVVTIGSMVERETKLPQERVLVSSVIANRLRLGMHLEIDATIEYVLPGNRFRLRNSQLRIDSPYNTYKYAGLPPGPIASPGLASLQAAASPASSGYLYYVLTGKDGSHTFTTNKADFLVAKQKSKEVFGR